MVGRGGYSCTRSVNTVTPAGGSMGRTHELTVAYYRRGRKTHEKFLTLAGTPGPFRAAAC